MRRQLPALPCARRCKLSRSTADDIGQIQQGAPALRGCLEWAPSPLVPAALARRLFSAWVTGARCRGFTQSLFRGPRDLAGRHQHLVPSVSVPLASSYRVSTPFVATASVVVEERRQPAAVGALAARGLRQ